MDDFDPDAYLASKGIGQAQPHAVPQGTPVGQVEMGQFDPDQYLANKSMQGYDAAQAKYGTIPQQILTGLEGGAKGFAGPIATGAEAALSSAGVPGLTPEDQSGRAEANPGVHGITEFGSFVGPAILSGGISAATRIGLEAPEAITAAANLASEYGVAGVLGKAGAGATDFLGIGGEGASALSRIGSSSVRGLVETGLYQAQDNTSRIINGQTPDGVVQTALSGVGLSALLGGVFGGVLGSGSELWGATVGPKVSGFLGRLAGSVGGIEGANGNPLMGAAESAGIELPPNVAALGSEDPAIRARASTLSQRDTTWGGRTQQADIQKVQDSAAEALKTSLGAPANEMPDKFDQYFHGQQIANALSDEVRQIIDPLKAQYDGYAKQFSEKELAPSIAEKSESMTSDLLDAQNDLQKATKRAVRAQSSGDPEASIEAAAKVADAQAKVFTVEKSAQSPGTVDLISQDISQLADREGWLPSSDKMALVNDTLSDLMGVKNLKQIGSFIQEVGDKAGSDPMNKPLMRAGGQIKGILRKYEGDLIGEHVGSEEGQDALLAYKKTQSDWAAASDKIDTLRSRLKIKSSTSGYANAIREMGDDRGEAVFRRLSGKTDASILEELQKNFPKTAESVRQAHIDELLSNANKNGKLNPYTISTNLKKMSPQLQDFVVPKDSAERVGNIVRVLDGLKDPTHNWSNTARTIDKLNQWGLGSAAAVVTRLLSHSEIAGAAAGVLSKMLSKDAPDAINLAMLKWMGSPKPVEPGAFKGMVDLFQGALKGDLAIGRTARAVLAPAASALEDDRPSAEQIADLGKKVDALSTDPDRLMNSAGNVSYYLPDHGAAMASTATGAVGYLNSIKPRPQKLSPLDPEIEPSEMAKAAYNRALMIAEKPLVVGNLMKQGLLTQQDMAHFKAMYPALCERFTQRVCNEMVEKVARGEPVPYQLRQSISTLMGQPMDSSRTPQSIITNQMAFSQAAQQANQAPGGQKAKGSTVGMRELKGASRISLHAGGDD